MGKKKSICIKIQIKAQQANPSPPIGPALGQHHINIMEFCKQFNEKTKDMEKGSPIPTIIKIYSDKSFKFIIKEPSVSFLIKKIVGIKCGSSNPKKEEIGIITIEQIKEIAKMKLKD